MPHSDKWTKVNILETMMKIVLLNCEVKVASSQYYSIQRLGALHWKWNEINTENAITRKISYKVKQTQVREIKNRDASMIAKHEIQWKLQQNA